MSSRFIKSTFEILNWYVEDGQDWLRFFDSWWSQFHSRRDLWLNTEFGQIWIRDAYVDGMILENHHFIAYLEYPKGKCQLSFMFHNGSYEPKEIQLEEQN